MAKFVTIQLPESDKNALQTTAATAASKLGMKKLSLSQLIHIMHEQYKQTI